MATQRNFTAEDVQKKLLELPEEIKELLYSPEMVSAIQKVGERNKLHYDQMGILERETTNVLLGFTEPADYPQILASTLSLNSAQAESVARDMNDTLFSQIRNSMKAGYEHSNADENEAVIKNPPAMASAPAEKSVVMPSSVNKPAEAASAPAPVPVTKPIAPPPPATTPIKPAEMPTMPHVDAMLTQPTVSIAPAAPTPPATTPTPAESSKENPPATPPTYKTDPYHEPID